MKTINQGIVKERAQVYAIYRRRKFSDPYIAGSPSGKATLTRSIKNSHDIPKFR